MHRILCVIAYTVFASAMVAPIAAQAVLSGRVSYPRYAGAKDDAMLSTVLAFAAPADAAAEPASFRTWETEPVGWYRLAGASGRHTLLFTQPAHYMRPFVVTNVYAQSGEKLDRRYTPRFDFANFDDKAYDKERATNYYQTFVAKSKSVTHVGFKLATDGVDGAGPGSQTMLLSIHRKPANAAANVTPDQWPQVGPTMSVFEVDCGGPKNYAYSAGWNSGEVPTTPGETYAVRLRTEARGGTVQAFWREDNDPSADCYRVGSVGPQGFVKRDLWMSVAGDGDGLVIPLNKRIHRQFETLTSCKPKWQQTYVAAGRSLASVICYAAVSGAQPPLSRQRVMVRVRKGGPDGPQVGIERVAIGNGNYTGDASWGVFGTVFAPGEVPLEPGQTYAIEMESLENYETLHGFVNIKGQISDDKPGFNPYKKHARDPYDRGTAFLAGKPQDFDLDMQITEYEHAATDWHLAVDEKNFAANGDMSSVERGGESDAANPTASRPAAWQAFRIDTATLLHYTTDGAEPTNRIARVIADSKQKKTADGGYVQRVENLEKLETYRLAVRVRASWPLDDQHQLLVGYDPTGQTEDPRAASIVWTSLPKLHGVWNTHTSEPIRPKDRAISIWLRGRTTAVDPWPYKADFDDVTLRRVRTEPPGEVRNAK